jgi:hypothetical protein
MSFSSTGGREEEGKNEDGSDETPVVVVRHSGDGTAAAAPTESIDASTSAKPVPVDEKEADVVQALVKKHKLERSPTVGVPGSRPDAQHRLVSGSDAAFLASVGLERFAPGLRGLGFHSIDDYVAVRSHDLLEIGLSPVEVNIFKLLQTQIPEAHLGVVPRGHAGAAGGVGGIGGKSLVDLRVDDLRKSRAWIPEVTVECGICEEAVASSAAVRMSCCGVFFCHGCLRRFLSAPIMHDQPLTCPSPECREHEEAAGARHGHGAGGVLPRRLFGTNGAALDQRRHRQLAAGAGGAGNSHTRNAAAADDDADGDDDHKHSDNNNGDAFSLLTVAAVYQDYCAVCCQQLENPAAVTRNTCPGLHAFCTSCFRGCVVSMIRSHRIPRCPRWRECRQHSLDAAVVDALCDDDPASLARFYDLNVENARAIHRFTRPCPRADCRATITIPPRAAGQPPNPRSPASASLGSSGRSGRGDVYGRAARGGGAGAAGDDDAVGLGDDAFDEEEEEDDEGGDDDDEEAEEAEEGDDDDEWDAFVPLPVSSSSSPTAPGDGAASRDPRLQQRQVAICSECDGHWCTVCWRCAHPGLDCQEAIEVEARWLQFKELQTDVSAKMQQSIRQ